MYRSLKIIADLNIDKGEIIIINYQFLYTCFAFSCIFLWFYVCFSVTGQFLKEMEERSLNGAKIGEIGKFLRSWVNLGRLVDRYQSTVFGSELASWRQQSEKCQFFLFQTLQRWTTWQIQFQTFFAILRTSKTHSRS